MQILIDSNTLYQSRYLYLQSAGSTGTDGSLPGVHLRWDLMNELGKSHIPKGNLANNPTGDNVKLFRSKYIKKYPVEVDLTVPPSQIVDSAKAITIGSIHVRQIEDRLWIYKSDKLNTNDTVYIRFVDVAKYDSITIDPQTDTLNFLHEYEGSLIEVSVKDKLSFAANVHLTNFATNPELKIESITSSNCKVSPRC